MNVNRTIGCAGYFLVLAALVGPGRAAAEASHHQGGAGQVISTALVTGAAGTYPDTATANSKQVGGEAKLLLAPRELAPRVSVVVGTGYRLRLGGVKDEVTAYAFVPVRVMDAATLTPGVSAGMAVGVGEVAKNVVTPGVAIAWQVHRDVDLAARHYRTLFGRNVVDADIFSIGAGYTL